LLLIVAFIANKNDPFIYALLGLGIIAPVIVFIFGIFGVFIYFISKVSGRIGGISLDIFQKFKRKK